ncbi:MAG: undecaprenyl-diphosphate phosphatase, partial [Oscillospiraceae bacterium]|nr:undecaprenyl-diphosphate phosphatase [Oscillospiraceae bacterium]
MTVWKAIFLGIVQGVAEFLPISSSGHLSIAQNLLFSADAVANDNLFFDVLLHLGTLLAIFVAYWTDVKEMIVEFFGGARDILRRSTPSPVPPARRLVMLVILGTLPLFLILPIKDSVETLYSNTWFVGCALIVTGFLLFAADRY